jgi:hypothetical protein
LTCREHGPQCRLRLRPEERKPLKDDLHATGAHVLAHDLREGVPRELAAVRALQVGELDESHRRIGRAENDPALLNAGEERLLS